MLYCNPLLCPFCGEEKSDFICTSCLELLDKRNEKIDIENADLSYYIYFYNDFLKDKIFSYKFKRRLEMKKAFAKILQKEAQNLFDLNEITHISYVPMHKKKENKLSFNHFKLVCEDLALLLDKKIYHFYKDKYSQSMHKLGKPERMKFIKDSFSYKEKVNSEAVLIVDDIITTGASLCECSKVLKDAGFKKVYCLLLAKGR